VVTGVLLIYVIVDVVTPIAVSTLGRRHGWSGGGPRLLNVLGGVLVVVGALVVARALAGHRRAIRARDWDVVKVDPHHLLTPEYLVVDGLYARTRNPLYVGDVVMWIGWAALLGSVSVAVGALLLSLGLQIGARLEERGLAKQFGEQWASYAREVPRFIGKRTVRARP
jgi:protein-S-isoprenylcysteine O-methyltransferase Ste14